MELGVQKRAEHNKYGKGLGGEKEKKEGGIEECKEGNKSGRMITRAKIGNGDLPRCNHVFISRGIVFHIYRNTDETETMQVNEIGLN